MCYSSDKLFIVWCSRACNKSSSWNSSLNTWNNFNRNRKKTELKTIFDYCKEYQMELAISLFIGYPYESLESIKNMMKRWGITITDRGK